MGEALAFLLEHAQRAGLDVAPLRAFADRDRSVSRAR
jgi:hypothetical protein